MLQKDQTISPLPEDFKTAEGFSQYRDTMKVPLAQVIGKMIKYRFLVRPESSPPPTQNVTKIYFKVVKARGLLAKEGRSRDAYCSIEIGDLDKKKKEVQVFQTDIIKNSLSPQWDQHINIQSKSATDKIKVQVWDKLKDQFLGETIISIGEIVKATERDDFLSNWFKLLSRGKSSDKYVGGEIFIEATEEESDKKGKKTGRSYEAAQRNLNAMGCDNRSLFKALMRACISLDLKTASKNRNEILSPESLSMLKLWIDYWGISQACQIIQFLSIIFQKYQHDYIPIDEVLRIFHILYSNMKNKGWFPSSEVCLFFNNY